LIPAYMKKHPAGWYGTAEGSPTHKQKQAWEDHGYTVETVDIPKGEVTFIKLGEDKQRKARQRSNEIDINKMAVVLLWAGSYVKTRIGHELFNLTKNPIVREQGFELYEKEGKVANEYTPSIVETHIEKIIMNGYKVRFIFKNKQEIVKEWKYEHRRYCKAY